MIPIVQPTYDYFSKYRFSKLERNFFLNPTWNKKVEKEQFFDLSKFNNIQQRWMSIEWWRVTPDSSTSIGMKLALMKMLSLRKG